MRKYQKIAVTGASGFIGGHCVRDLLSSGYSVRAVVRSSSSADAIKDLAKADNGIGSVETTIASLDQSGEWPRALAECDALFHVASPLPAGDEMSKEALIETAVTGTLNVLNGAKAAGVQRVVLTSSLGAVCGSALHENGTTYSADDWTDPNDPDASDYNLSKTLAELAARELADETSDFELLTVNPGVTIGPILNGRMNASNGLLLKIMAGQFSILPPITYEFVDVRDVATLQRKVLESGVNMDRVLCSSEFLSFKELAAKIAEADGSYAHLSAIEEFEPANADTPPEPIASYMSDFKVYRPVERQQSQQQFDWFPRPIAQTIVDSLPSIKNCSQ